MRGILSDEEHYRILNLFSRAGLSMDHHQFNEDILDKATKAILRTRDGLLRAAVPSPLGQCVFLNDVSMEEMNAALHKHKDLMKNFPRNGKGLEAFVDATDTGYTMNNKPVESNGNGVSNGVKEVSVLGDDTRTNGAATNRHHKVNGNMANGAAKAIKHATGEGENGLLNGAKDVAPNGLSKVVSNGVSKGLNGHTNGVRVHGVH